MYVIEVSGSAAVTGIDKAANAVVQVPADRCSWTITEDSTGGYSISAANFYPGNAAAVDINPSNSSARLGFVGKTGRFTAITN